MGAPRREAHTKGHGCVAGGSSQAQQFIAEQKAEEELERAIEEHLTGAEAKKKKKTKRNPLYQLVYLEFSHSGTSLGRCNFRLYDEYYPQACDNFRRICEGKTRGLSFQSSLIHKIMRGSAVYGGDITHNDGTGGTTVLNDGVSFPDESNPLKHDSAGVLSTVRTASEETNSQFLITLDKDTSLDGKHTVFGNIVSGGEVLAKLNEVAVDSSEGLHPTCRPVDGVEISACGLVEVGDAEGSEEEDLDALDEGELVEVLSRKAKKAKVERKEARENVQSALMAGLKKKKKKDKNIKDKEGARVSSLPVLGL